MKDASGWPAALVLAAAIAVLLLALTPLTTLWDRDEARFARAAVEMRASGNFLVPTFSGDVRPQKPPLIYWLMTVTLALFGEREMAVRFWSPVGMAIAALATYAIGRRLASPRVALLAMIVLALTPLTIVEGVAATTDAMLLGFITASMAVAVQWLFRPVRWWEVAALGVLLGLGALTKGPLGIGVPIAVVATTLALVRRDRASSWRTLLALGTAAGAGAAIFAAWYIPAAGQAAAIGERGPVYETIARVFEIREGHGTAIAIAPLYYAGVIVVGFIPWTGRLWRAARTAIQSRDASLADVLLAVWILLPILAFTLVATKLPHYILPVWPALAIAVARTFDAGDARDAAMRRLRRTALLSAAALLLLAAVAGPVIERFKPVAPVARAIRATNVPGPLFVYAFGEPSLVFYSGRPLVEIPNEAALVEWTHAPGPAILAAPRDEILRIERFYGPLNLRELAAKGGWNYVKGTRLELVAFVRASDR